MAFIVPPVGRDVYRIGHGNVYVGNKKPATALAIARQTKATSFGFNEATKIAARCAALKTWRDFGADAGFKDMSDARDCITIVQNSMQMLHHSYTEVSKDVAPLKLGHDRGITAIAYKKAGLPPIAHINVHPNAINHLPAKATPPLVDEYVKNMASLSRLQVYLRSHGWNIVTTGDFNITQANARDRSYLTPYSIARMQNMNALGIGVDGIIWDKTLRVVKRNTIPKNLTGSDHLWFYVDFKVA